MHLISTTNPIPSRNKQEKKDLGHPSLSENLSKDVGADKESCRGEGDTSNNSVKTMQCLFWAWISGA